MKIIGVGGTNGSGKDTLCQLLEDDYGWLFISVSRDLIIPELKRRNLPPEREHMANLTTEWRKDPKHNGMIEKAVKLYEQKGGDKKYSGLVISSLRHPLEVNEVHDFSGKVIWIDADPKIRYKRITNRGHGHKDEKTFEQFLAEEQVEMSHSGDETTLNMSAVKSQADIRLTNNSNNIATLEKSFQTALSSYL